MKCGFSPSVFKYWRVCFQQRWQTRSNYRTLFYEVLLNDPNFEGAKWGELWKWLMAHGKHFWGSCSAIRVDIWVLGWMLVAEWVFFLLMGVSSCLLSHATQKTKPGYILSVGKVISKKKALFSGGRTAVESFKRLNNCACSRSVSLAAECFGESSTESHLFVILSKPEQDGRELWIRCGDAGSNVFLQENNF